ncbi:IS3 family transposase [Carboxylicivirga sp. N1Y90]|uniref:IS3 family transposase n=1 Tax=Carboxylicivirga fragile TaxID=3417571 RepID=UPI003D3503F3|nr:IS3 family transposase [Marinilabiliaceae bacterium N1Y90]
MGLHQRHALVNKASKKLSIKKQCNLLSLSRSGYYHKPKRESTLNKELMEVIDKQHMKYPFMGVPTMTQWLRRDMNYSINTKRIERLYKLMDICAIVPGPHTSKGNKKHKKYPYLLRNLEVNRTNQVWALDITYIPIKNGYMYLIAIIDLYSRYVVGWSLSNTMESEWCMETVKKAIAEHGLPEIINTDQGSQFTSEVFTNYLHENDITISMDGKGRATDNIFIERLWRSLKYEDIYLNAYENGLDVYRGIKRYFIYYNEVRRHSSINHKRPKEVYCAA